MKADYHWVRVTVQSAGQMVQCFDWLANQDFKFIDIDPGRTSKFSQDIVWDFGFQDVSHALLFKLAWGGQ